MKRPVVFRRLARIEFDEAADWYEQRRAGLGAIYTEAVQRAFDQIAAQPDFFPRVHLDIREAMVFGFPYCVYYEVKSARIVVLSVFHTSRNPSIWQGRTRN